MSDSADKVNKVKRILDTILDIRKSALLWYRGLQPTDRICTRRVGMPAGRKCESIAR